MWVGKVRSGHRDDVRIAGGHCSGGHPEIGHASSDEDGGTTVQTTRLAAAAASNA